MEHTQVRTPLGAERKRIKTENLEQFIQGGISFVRQHLLDTMPDLNPAHQETIMALHQPSQWRQVYEHVLINRR